MGLLNLFFPKQCISCHREGNSLCEDCIALVSLNQTVSPLPANSALSGLFCATSFKDPNVKYFIHSLKYPPFLRDLAKPLAFLIVSHFAILNNTLFTPDMIIPVPLHTRRLHWRGFNHAEEIAKHLSFAWEVPLESKALQRIKYTAPQVELGKEKRHANVKGMFATPQPSFVQGKTIFLIDDVYTTGATMQECASVLKKAGAAKVFGAVVARD